MELKERESEIESNLDIFIYIYHGLANLKFELSIFHRQNQLFKKAE